MRAESLSQWQSMKWEVRGAGSFSLCGHGGLQLSSLAQTQPLFQGRGSPMGCSPPTHPPVPRAHPEDHHNR